VVEHLAKVAAIHPPAARGASIKMLGFVSGRIAHATTDVLHARELNDRAVLFRHLVPPIREPRPRALGRGPSELSGLGDRSAPPGKHFGAAEVPHGTSGTKARNAAGGVCRAPTLNLVRSTDYQRPRGGSEMCERLMSDEFDGLDATEKAGIGAALNRCRALAAKIANELRNKRPEHFVDKLSLADIHACLERAADVLSRVKGSQARHR
jgi:hypothetical protein